jgi:hypothetical protein
VVSFFLNRLSITAMDRRLSTVLDCPFFLVPICIPTGGSWYLIGVEWLLVLDESFLSTVNTGHSPKGTAT